MTNPSVISSVILDNDMVQTVKKYTQPPDSTKPLIKPLSRPSHIINGLLSKSILIRSKDDTFLTFDCTVIIIDEYDLSTFWKCINEHKQDHNIILDSRLTWLILYSILKYENDMLIYNVYNSRIITIYRYFSELSGITINELSMYRIKQITILKLLLSHFLYNFDISWNISNIIKNINKFTNKTVSTKISVDSKGDEVKGKYRIHEQTNKTIFMNILLNYIGIRKTEEINNENVKRIIDLIKFYFSRDILYENEGVVIKPWIIEGANITELCTALKQMKQNNYEITLLNEFN